MIPLLRFIWKCFLRIYCISCPWLVWLGPQINYFLNVMLNWTTHTPYIERSKIVKKLQYQICAGDILLLHYYTRATSPKLHWFQILEDCAPLEFCICIISKVHLAYHANLKVSCLKVMVIRSIALLRASRPQ